MSSKYTYVRMEKRTFERVQMLNRVLRYELTPVKGQKDIYSIKQSYLQMLIRFLERQNERAVVVWGISSMVSVEEIMQDVSEGKRKVEDDKQAKEKAKRQAVFAAIYG